MTPKSLFYLLVLAILCVACSNDPLDVNASDQNVKMEFVNMDAVLANSDSTSFVEIHDDWKQTMPDIYNYQLGHCLQLPELSGGETFGRINTFRSDNYISSLEKEISTLFTSKKLEVIESQITEGFKRLKYHFPNQGIPQKLVFMNSLFASNVFCTEKEVGIGLERYLGSESASIKALPEHEFYGWIKEAMDDKYLVRDVFTGWISTHFMDEPKGSLVEQMVYWGKVVYFTEAAMPDQPKHIIMRYEKEDLDWAKKNEFGFWEYLVNEKLLFKTEELNITNMLKEGPFTPGLPEKGPDRLGQYLGWQMVKQYVEAKQIPLKDLFTTSYNDILQNYEIE
jgi:hypothetical protein